jgi:hypothetical protein
MERKFSFARERETLHVAHPQEDAALVDLSSLVPPIGIAENIASPDVHGIFPSTNT